MLKRFSFRSYFFLENIFWIVCAVLPQFARDILFKAVFKSFGRGATIDYGCYVRYPWKVSIGRGSMLNRGCRIYASYAVQDAMIIIGDNVALAPDVILCGASHDYGSLDLPDTAATITVKDRAWIGCRSIIMPGVVIGEGAVVGTGSVVTKNVAPWSVVAGSPAKEISRRNIPQV